MPEISIKLGFQDTSGWNLAFDHLELHTPTLLKLWDSPALLWLYLSLLIMPSKYWDNLGSLEFRSIADLREVLRSGDQANRLEKATTQVYALIRHLQRIVLPGMSEDLRREWEAWAAIKAAYEQEMSELPVSPNAPVEAEILQEFQPLFAASLREALEESDWVACLQAQLAMKQFQAEIGDLMYLQFLLDELRNRNLVNFSDYFMLSIYFSDLKWKRDTQSR